ncbi:MAG: archease [Candidatus Palauibacterales bacterium]|nr:archease [Candidatus Palauibacterales bacterium]
MYRVDPLSHTADVGFEVTADSLAELFRGAADGLVRTVREEEGPAGIEAGDGEAGEDRETIDLDRPDRERLMVAWLRELLYRISRDGRYPEAMTLEMSGPSSLRARVRWSSSGPEQPPVRDVKGVTYHGLRVEGEENGRWHARLVLDV